MEYIKEPPLKSKDGSFFVLQSTALFDIIKIAPRCELNPKS